MSKNMVLHTFFSVTFRKQYRVSGTAVDFVFVFGSHPYTIYIVLSFFYPDPQEDIKKKKKKCCTTRAHPMVYVHYEPTLFSSYFPLLLCLSSL